MSDAPQAVTLQEQAYDFANAELSTRLSFAVGAKTAEIEVLTFCSRDHPTLACQEIAISVNGACDLRARARVDISGIQGRPVRHGRQTPGEPTPACDGYLLWASAGALSTMGLAYSTELLGEKLEADRPALNGTGLTSEYGWRARRGRRYRLRQLASLIPQEMHRQPDFEAARMVALAADIGFDDLRRRNRACWAELWKGRIRLVGAEQRWQAMTDAAFFYLMSSVHPSSPSSTSIFGLATWHDYHYYYGHVMWDIETFCVPPLIFLQPAAAETLLDYRLRCLEGARGNAQLMGRNGLQFPWESAPSSGQEATPVPGTSAWREDHVSLDVARAFSLFADVTGDEAFAREKAWPVLSGVADWVASRVERTGRGYEICDSMGIAERERAVDNPAFTNMSAQLVLKAAVRLAHQLGMTPNPDWQRIADALVLPTRGDRIVSHDAYRTSEEKAATPDPLMGVFPLQFGLEAECVRATLDFYLERAGDYLGSPMLSALYGVWAARAGDRETAARMLEDGYARFCTGRFLQTLEYRPDVFPEQPQAGPFFANIGGLLLSLILGFGRVEPGPDGPETWPRGPVVLPEGWRSIEIDRMWIRGEAWRLSAVHGARAAVLQRV
jgi:trehalose/maltose hydrolase-like predicted phosphorylase